MGQEENLCPLFGEVNLNVPPSLRPCRMPPASPVCRRLRDAIGLLLLRGLLPVGEGNECLRNCDASCLSRTTFSISRSFLSLSLVSHISNCTKRAALLPQFSLVVGGEYRKLL